jgi:dimethylargininase
MTMSDEGQGSAMYSRAIVRQPGENCALGITTAGLGAPDYELLLAQHAAYVQTLRALGLQVIALEAHPGYPDGYFVEDTAVVTPRVAVIARPGAEARRGEEEAIAPVLARYRPTVRIQAPGTVDGGDVLMVGNHVYVGISERTNEEGARQLERALVSYGHTWTPVPVGAGLHLKSGVNCVGENTLLLGEAFARRDEFRVHERIVVDADEAYAANTLWVNGCLIVPRGYPRTREKLGALGLEIVELDVSEMRKMDGGLTCLSLRF